MAERVGFEPTVGFPTSVFKTDAIDHSATSPSMSLLLIFAANAYVQLRGEG